MYCHDSVIPTTPSALQTVPGSSWDSQVEILVEPLYPDDSPENGLGEWDGGVGVNVGTLSAEVARLLNPHSHEYLLVALHTHTKRLAVFNAWPNKKEERKFELFSLWSKFFFFCLPQLHPRFRMGDAPLLLSSESAGFMVCAGQRKTTREKFANDEILWSFLAIKSF